MQRRYHVPHEAVWPDQADVPDRARLERVILAAVRQAVEDVAVQTPGGVVAESTRSGVTLQDLREAFVPARYRPEQGTYQVPSYQDGGMPTEVPVAEAAETGTADLAPDLPATPEEPQPAAAGAASVDSLVGLIQRQFPESGGLPSGGVYRAVYVDAPALEGKRIYYLDLNERGERVLRPLRYHYTLPDGSEPAVNLAAGHYSIVAIPFGGAHLYQGGRLIRADIRNPRNLDMTVNFYVPPDAADAYDVTVYGYRYRFYPRMRIVRVSQEPMMSTGSESVFLASVDIYRVEESGEWARVYPLALIYAFIDYHWEIYKLETRRGGTSQRRRIYRDSSGDAFLRYTWEEPGTYEIICGVRLRDDEASPRPVYDSYRQEVVPVEVKMTHIMAQIERSLQTGERIWYESPQALLAHYRAMLSEEEANPRPNQARIRMLREIIQRTQRQIQETTTAGPFAIRAIFTERRTSQTRPLNLFLGPALPDDGAAHTWKLIDLTYTPFYATYTGSGQTVREAIIAAFDDARTSIRNKYPLGNVLARLEWPNMRAMYGLEPQDFIIETESWQRSAYEWLSVGAAIVGAGALAAALVFPPSAVLTGTLVVTGLAGAALSAANIIERIQTNHFEWDAETFVDIANIAAAFAFVGAAAARGAAGGIARGIAQGVPLEVSALSRLRYFLRVERAMLYTGLGTDMFGGVVLSWDTYIQLRDLDAAFTDESLAEYRRIYGDEEGYARWRNERYVRILGVLVRAAVNGLMIMVSVRGSRQAASEIAGQLRALRIPGAHLPPSQRIRVERGRPTDDFPQNAWNNLAGDERRAFIEQQHARVAERLGLPANDPAVQALGPQIAWDIHAHLRNLDHQQLALIRRIMRGPQDLDQIRGFINGGGSLEELANFLRTQPDMVVRHINTFRTGANRLEEFRNLQATMPDLSNFHWNQANLDQHFNSHVLGGAGYPDEAWKWAQRLGIAADYNLTRADYLRLLTSVDPGDVALLQRFRQQYTQAYADYVSTVMARTNAYYRTGPGGDLVGTDGELLWFARVDGTISSGYFPDSPTFRRPGPQDDLEGIFTHVVRGEQAVILVSGRAAGP